MRRPILEGLAPFPMFIFSSLTVLFTGLLFQLLGVVTATLVYPLSFDELSFITGIDDPVVIAAAKWIQIVGGLGTFVFSSLLLSFLYTGSWTGYFRFRTYSDPAAWGLVVLMVFLGLPFVNYLTEINQQVTLPFEGLNSFFRGLEDQTELFMRKFVETSTWQGLLVNILMIAMIPAIGEELVFRGLLQRHFTEMTKNPHVAILITSAIFSLVHFQLFSFLPRFFLGLILGYLYLYGRSLWFPVLYHLVNNGTGVLFYFLYYRETTGDGLETIGTSELVPVAALVSLLSVTAVMVIWVLRVKRVNQTVPHDWAGKG